MRPVIVWFRRDLRVDDNPALIHAALTGAPLVPLFIVDTDIVNRLPSDGAVFDFQAACLRELASDLASINGRLVIRSGRAVDVHTSLIGELQPAGLYLNRDYEPAARERDRRIAELYSRSGIPVHAFKDAVVHEPEEVLTPEGRPYVVFTPYARAWKRLECPAPSGRPGPLISPDVPTEEVPDAGQLGKPVRIASPLCEGGSSRAQQRWGGFLTGGIGQYRDGRDFPARDGTSVMSPYLRFGAISVRRLLADCRAFERTAGESDRVSAGKFIDELIWREFYQAVLFHFPRLLESNYREEFDAMPWRFDEALFDAWRNGRTGFPLVDAGMRELNRTGWMHNRVRMVVASFLTKDLMHDWRLGETVFAEKLLDIETASNNGGWQWSAGTGVDPRPLRIFNPRLQSERYDPDGAYIRRYVPELAHVPARHIHAPHEMPVVVQEAAACRIGRDYPLPIVDHSEASRLYKSVFAATKLRRAR